ncbi:uncharacterized protein LACBIDRAFT_313369 [Laccaria bicolor S238N-H82]|uniref:Predicted protein n=1 Tax=Laccaria bicolor (strain S238N-H82 / ATCC MYA-4686) TaxID=486041 RepID=B0DY63_LACBS|nr:uncharacterized protein LACBIDRAFT_313369 [Laccaria bicolor S238N-H82]EDR00507.1 predicted protein [Laccaria bicolor S238N-H82]|eukprot:XP_001888899.1 predicted protein [Laccaria bicolor S238N-H82]
MQKHFKLSRSTLRELLAAKERDRISLQTDLMQAMSIMNQLSSPLNDPNVVESRRRAAVKTVRILEKEGLPCAIFGSMACKLYGNERGPYDVDILVLPPPSRHDVTLSDIKNIIIAASPEEFGYLGPSSNDIDARRPLYFQAKIRIDVVLPGMMNLPALLPAQIKWTTGSESTRLPVLPFDLLLFQKLQAWDDHRNARGGKFSHRISNDVKDIQWMLREGVPKYMKDWKVVGHDKWNNRSLFSEGFERLTKERVTAFCADYWYDKPLWRAIGFRTSRV